MTRFPPWTETASRADALTRTAPKFICLIAGRLPQPFTLEDLIVNVWQKDEKRFGLRGYQKMYPNNKKIEAIIYGKKGLIARGLLHRLGGGLFSTVLPQKEDKNGA